MRIGVDLRCLMDGKRTGVEEYTLGILDAMIRAAPQDDFVLFANSRKPMRLPSFAEPNVVFRAFRYPNKLFNLSLKVAHWPTLDALAGDVDVFFVPSIRLAPLRARCPLVLTVHDLSFVRHPQFFSLERRMWHTFMEPKALAQQATAVVAVSEATAQDVAALYGVSPARITVVPSGIPEFMEPPRQALDTSQTPGGANIPHQETTSSARDTRGLLGAGMTRVPANPAADAVQGSEMRRCRERYRLPKRFLLYLGTLEPRKNLDGLLDAYGLVRAAGLPHALVLAGVRGWVDEGFFARLRKHPYHDDIVLTGFVEDADKPFVYQLADLFVYPSFYEGFGFPPLEALACGTPVVTSFNSAIPEIAGEWAALVNPYDPQELAMVIAERLRHPFPVSLEVSEEIRRRYSWERAGRETLLVLREAARASKASEASKASQIGMAMTELKSL
ncbi:MAG: glycosyltransferase family 1 protein [bacterium]|nr:glycosyltransferase family 1 protein [bacterium]